VSIVGGVECIGSQQMSFGMALADLDDVFDRKAIGTQEIAHRVGGSIRFQGCDLLTHEALGIGGPVIANVFAPGKRDIVAAAFGVDDAIVGFGEGAMIDPDVARRGTITNGNEVPIVLVVVALAGIIPLPHFIELEIANDDVRSVLDVELRVAGASASV